MRGWWELIIGAVMLGGGLSGKLVLRGTNSSWALAVIGGLIFIWGIVSLVMGYRKRRAATTAATSNMAKTAPGQPGGQLSGVLPGGTPPTQPSTSDMGDDLNDK